MNFRKHLLAILAIGTVAAIGIIPLPTAQAEPPTEEVGPSLPVELAAKVEKTLSLLFTTKGGTAVAISCEKITPEKVKIEAEGKGSGTLSFGSCSTKLNGTTTSKCEPFVGAEKGVIKSKALKGLLVTHESTSLVKIEPVSGTMLANIQTGETCAISEEVPVEGTFYAKESNGFLEALKETHPFEEGPLTAIKALGQTATIDGSASFNPTGAHVGRLWSGLGSKPVWLLDHK